MGGRRKFPVYSEYTAIYFRVYGRILRSVRQEYFSTTSSMLTNTSKSVDYHTQVWVYESPLLFFDPLPPYFQGAKLIFSYPMGMGTRND